MLHTHTHTHTQSKRLLYYAMYKLGRTDTMFCLVFATRVAATDRYPHAYLSSTSPIPCLAVELWHTCARVRACMQEANKDADVISMSQ